MRFKNLAFGFVIFTPFALAEGIATDGSMGVAQTLSGVDVSIPQTLGKTHGNNLFHSFSDFNINQGQTVTFSGTDNLQNVISRVTGDSKSIIDGTLKSEIKNADFYFINPNGITFNADASVDVPAAFHVTTADKMDFDKNGGVFYSDKSKQSQLSSESPTALGFLGTSKVNNGLLDFNGSQITLNKAQTMDVVAGNITVENAANVKSETGEVRLVAMQDKGSVSLVKTTDGVLPLPDKTPSNINAGNVTIDGSTVDTRSGDGAGRISMWGGNIAIKNDGAITTNNTSNTNATAIKGIDIRTKSLDLLNGGGISSNSNNRIDDAQGNETNIILGTGKGGSIDIEADAVKLDSGYISADTRSNGDAGSVKLKTKSLDLVNYGKISSSSFGNSIYDAQGNKTNVILGTGKSGNIDIEADAVKLDSSSITASTFSNGDAGSVRLYAKTLVLVINDGYISSRAEGEESSIGNAGNLKVVSEIIDIQKGGYISSSTFSTIGHAGNIDVASKTLTITGTGSGTGTGFGTGIFSSSWGSSSNGQTGDITVLATDKISMANGSEINIANEAFLPNEKLAVIHQSEIKVITPSMDIISGNITSESKGNVPSGNIIVNFTNRLNMENSFINTTANTGDGGAININGSDVIYLKDSGFKTTVSGENSNGGDISVKAKILVMDTGLIQANAVSGNGGNINLALQALIPSANQLIKGGKLVDWDKSPSNIIQAASQSGVSGTVNNSAPQMNLSGVLANIGNNNFDNRLVSQDYCAVNKSSSLSKKGKGGLPSRAKDLQVY